MEQKENKISDRDIADTVNKLRDIALFYYDHQSLRQRIADVIVPLLKGK